jgi:hypothetical protein
MKFWFTIMPFIGNLRANKKKSANDGKNLLNSWQVIACIAGLVVLHGYYQHFGSGT